MFPLMRPTLFSMLAVQYHGLVLVPENEVGSISGNIKCACLKMIEVISGLVLGVFRRVVV